MDFYGIDMKGSLNTERLGSLPSWISTDVGRLSFITGEDNFYVGGNSGWLNLGGFESDTSMVFNQAAAPTGWTKKSDWAANASLVVGNTFGSGGSDSPTSWSTEVSVDGHALTEAELASHVHTAGTLATNTTGAHTHTFDSFIAQVSWGAQNYLGAGSPTTGTTASNGDHAHTVTGSTATNGSGDAHVHPVTQDTYTPIYQVMITATRD